LVHPGRWSIATAVPKDFRWSNRFSSTKRYPGSERSLEVTQFFPAPSMLQRWTVASPPGSPRRL
jgi:hypothetical protein